MKRIVLIALMPALFWFAMTYDSEVELYWYNRSDTCRVIDATLWIPWFKGVIIWRKSTGIMFVQGDQILIRQKVGYRNQRNETWGF